MKGAVTHPVSSGRGAGNTELYVPNSGDIVCWPHYVANSNDQVEGLLFLKDDLGQALWHSGLDYHFKMPVFHITVVI